MSLQVAVLRWETAGAAATAAKLHAWRESVGAQMPIRNPGYDPAKPEHIAGKKFDGE